MMARPPTPEPPRGGTFLPLLLAVVCVATGVAVVQIKHHGRDVTAQLNHLRRERDRLHLEWAQLRLEQATLGGHARVQQLAQSQFDMIEPRSYVIVREPQTPGSAQ